MPGESAEELSTGITTRLLELVGDGVIVFDKDGIYRSWSPGMERISGVPASRRVGRSYLSLPSALAGMDSRDLVRRWLAGEFIEIPSAQLAYADGKSDTFIALKGAPVRGANGDVIGAMVVISDLTERRKAEQSMCRQREQLEHAMKMEAIGRLAGGVAHDFNNLLSIILSFANFARETAGSEAQSDLSEVIAAAERASALTRQLLLFSRRDPVETKVLSLGDVVTGLEKLLRRTLGEDIQLVVKSAKDGWNVRADPGRLEQVIANLAVNARDAMPGGGRLEIECSNTILPSGFDGKPAVRAGRYHRLSVIDSGCGIPPEIRERVFEPFFTTKPAGKGTGLGLSTVYAIVAEAGGCIQLESVRGRTAFNLFFPVTDEQPETELPHVTSIDTNCGTVLLAEDDPNVRAATRRILTQAGWKVIEAVDGLDAVERGIQLGDQLDLVLTDIVMPGLPGTEVVTRLREARPGLRFILMSGYPGDALSERGISTDANFLRKPITPVGLLEAIARARRRRTLQ